MLRLDDNVFIITLHRRLLRRNQILLEINLDDEISKKKKKKDFVFAARLTDWLISQKKKKETLNTHTWSITEFF